MENETLRKKYKVTVAGTGPGDISLLTEQVYKALKDADVITGYTLYTDLLRPSFPDKEYISTPMHEEEKRCRLAFEEARKGKRVVMACGGDAGIYGLAGLMLEIGADYPDCEVSVLPGVTAASAGAALLGAPINHDFAVISLSDMLTPWEFIEKRLVKASEADFVICLYNPASHRRADYLKRACEVLLKVTEGERICAVARNIGRNDEKTACMTLNELKDYPADMFTTVFIGNSYTKMINGKMVTPRGYKIGGK